jgi:Tol biopolymer transport system component
LETTGQPVPVLEDVQSSPGTGAGQFAASAGGTLVYLPGGVRSLEVPIEWMDRSGRTVLLREMRSDWSNPSFSPDGKQLAMDLASSGGSPDVWIYDWIRDTPTKLTFGGVNAKPIWTPDSRRIVFSSTRDSAAANLFWQRADGSGEVLRLAESKNLQVAGSWHPSGKLLAFAEQSSTTGWDILILPVDGDETSGWKIGKPTVFLNGPSNEQEPMFSADGRWLAYFSNESGRAQVYVRAFPGPGGLQQISNEGGTFPAWSRTRPELFYRDAINSLMMVAPYSSAGDSFRAEKPRVWAPTPVLPRPRLRPFALHPDGERVAIASATQAGVDVKQDKVVFIFNFFDELRRLAPSP